MMNVSNLFLSIFLKQSSFNSNLFSFHELIRFLLSLISRFVLWWSEILQDAIKFMGLFCLFLCSFVLLLLLFSVEIFFVSDYVFNYAQSSKICQEEYLLCLQMNFFASICYVNLIYVSYRCLIYL
jgi:hypothetical protein